MNDSNEIDNMAQMASDLDDLGNLFEFDLNNISDAAEYGDDLRQQHGTHPSTPFPDIQDAPALPGTSAHDFGGHDQFGLAQAMEHVHQQHFILPHDKHAPTSHPYTTDSMYQAAVQQQIYQQHPQPYQLYPQQGFLSNQHIPPTPNSFEMHGETGRFMLGHPQMDPQQRAIMEQRYHLRKDDAIAFTPIVSPAGTPQYNILPEFTTPGAYFSPLTSPMLHAQSQQHAHLQHQQQQGYLTNPSTAPSSNTNSPIDPNIDVEMLNNGMTMPHSAGPQPRKSRRKIATPRTAGMTTRGAQNAAQKPQKRKSTTASSNATTNSNGTFTNTAVRLQPPSASLQMPGPLDSSEAESISPEPLTESLMGPPPRPGSLQSPSIIGKQQNGGLVVGPAATPKSLLTMRNQQPINGQQDSDPMPMHLLDERVGLDDLSLPEAATRQSTRRPSLTQINTQIPLQTTDDSTPRLSARKTPKLGPLSTPASARPSSAMDSPIMGSPMTASTPSAILNKNDGRGGKGSKKRGSMSANGSKLVSPALVPKISPSIKPLLPEGIAPLNSAQQAILLASKSNYQNLVEGNRLPGVSYPDSLSTGLTSKRTSHKVAEQGRRNRINDALKEMQALIPKPASAAKSPSAMANGEGEGSPEEGEAERGGDGSFEDSKDMAAKSNSSKAATVELANDYIKTMQKDNASQNADILHLRQEIEELRLRLMEHGSQSGDQSPEKVTESVDTPPAS